MQKLVRSRGGGGRPLNPPLCVPQRKTLHHSTSAWKASTYRRAQNRSSWPSLVETADMPWMMMMMMMMMTSLFAVNLREYVWCVSGTADDMHSYSVTEKFTDVRRDSCTNFYLCSQVNLQINDHDDDDWTSALYEHSARVTTKCQMNIATYADNVTTAMQAYVLGLLADG